MHRSRYSGLEYTEWFASLKQDAINEISNGCGPKGGAWAVKLLTWWFPIMQIDFSPACDIHDCDYFEGVKKDEADRKFLRNCQVRANLALVPFRPIASYAAFMFYLAVKNGGAASYDRAQKENHRKIN